MTELDSAGTNRTAGNRGNVVAALGVVIVLGLLTACARENTLQPRTGDEPPIRVRGGTMHIDLLGDANDDFEPDNPGDKKKWHIKGLPNRDRDGFLVVVVSADPNCNGKVTSSRKVDVLYTDGQSVEFKSNNRQTKITAQKDLEYQAARWLKYEVQDRYINEIKVNNNQTLCTFGAKDSTLQIFLLD